MKPLKKSLFTLCLLSLLALTKMASAQVSVTTWQANTQHTGNNANETILTPGVVSSPGNFGLLFSQQLDGNTSGTISGQSFGQPLIASGISVSGTTHNIVYVCTQHDSIWAFDADTNVGPNANPIWSAGLLPAGTRPVPQGVVGSGDISIELGITTTPVIDLSTNTIYIVSKVQRTSDTTYHQYLYALDLATGTTKFNSPVEINPTFPGSSTPDSSGGVIPFSALHEHMRAAMTINNGILYLTYASHSDTTPYHGEVIGYNKTTLQQLPAQTFITTPNGMEGGLWGAGASPAFDVSGSYMFISVANGAWDQNNPQYGTDWGESMLKIPTSGTLAVSFSNTLNWFTPNNWNSLNGGDLDLGSGGLCILPDQAGPHMHIMVGGGKGAVLYVVDRDNLGGLNTPDTAIQEIPETAGDWLFVTPAYYNGYIYYSGAGGPLEQRAVGYNSVDGSYIAASPITSSAIFNVKGDGCFISSSGTTNGIVWILTGGGVMAYNASNVSAAPLFSANATLPGNIGCQNNKFSLPMVANGKLYYTAFDSTNTGHLLVYGLVASGSGTPTAPSNAIATANSASTVTVTYTDNSSNETGFSVKRSTSAAGPFTQVGTPGANVTTFTDTGLAPNTTYYYQVLAYNANGPSPASNVASTTTFPTYTANGLVAYLPLDETGGATVNDITGNGHTGTINGEAGITAGLINNGVEFHGTGQATSNITVANKADMQFAANQSFTLSAWVNAGALRSSEETIIAKSRDQGNYYGIWINASNQWVFRGPGGDIVGPAVTQGAWTHVAVVQNGAAGTRSLYINGSLAATGAAQAADGAGDMWVAQQNITGTFNSFPGTIDEIRLYNRALAASEITNLMATPVLQAASAQTQGAAGTFSLVIWPSLTQVTESRKGSTVGTYKLVLNFSAPVSGLSATLGLQGGGSAVGSVGTITYDSTGKVVTVPLTGVGNLQALNLHLTGVPSGTGAPAGTADVSFNVLWGDANGDNIVSTLDSSIVSNSHTTLVNSTTYRYDINCDGAVNATDDSLISAAVGTNLGPQTDTDLALFQPATSLSNTGGNPPGNAVDSNPTTSRWESAQAIDPEWIYVDLGSICTIHTVMLNWENAAGENYTIDVSNDATNWTTIKTVTGNLTAGIRTYTGFNTAARYVRMNGTMRDSPYGYSLWDYQVIGLSGSSTGSAPAITGGLTANGVVGTAFSYQITATNTPTSYTATGLPANLSLNTATGAITGMPAATGTTSVPISAINSSGTGTATLTIAVTASTPAPVITSGTTTSGTVGSAFSYQITASNTPTSFNATSLPGGLSVNTATGAITGSPTATGVTSVPISATNSGGTGTATLTITVNAAPPAPVITSGTAITGTAGVAFSYQITATNTPASFNATGLPAGLGVNTTTGAITGTPTATGTTSVPISATNVGGTGTGTVTITIVPGSAPVITSGTTATATVATPFSYQITASGNPTSYNATNLPSGLVVNTVTGAISGSPNISGTVNTTISAISASGTGTAVLNIVTSAGTDTNLAFGKTATASTVNGGNTAAMAVDQNTGTRWESVQGVTADPSYIYVDLGQVDTIHSVVIDWETAAAATYTIDVSNDATNWTTIQTVTGNTTTGVNTIRTYSGFNVTARFVRMNGTTRTTQYGYSIWEFQVFGVVGVSGAPAITSGTTASGNVNTAFSYQIAATNSPTSYGASGLPAGLSVNTSTGLISGTASASGTSTATISAVNTSGTGSSPLVIGIAAPTVPAITSGTTASATVGSPFSYQITATNTPTSYNATGLPAGLSVSTSTGLISGTATASGTTTATISAVNTSGTGTAPLVITATSSGDTNIALSQPATASSVQAGNTIANANDGSTTTRWAASAATYPQWWRVDLGANKTLSRLDTNWYSSASRSYKYRIEVSTDDVTYTTAVDKTGNTTLGDTSDSFVATARYVRITVTGCTAGGAFASAFEFKVYGH